MSKKNAVRNDTGLTHLAQAYLALEGACVRLQVAKVNTLAKVARNFVGHALASQVIRDNS